MRHPKARKSKLLLVEDDEHLAELIMLYLWSDGSNLGIEHAARVSHALDLIGAKTFDLLISDYDLPDGKGLEVVKAFQAHYENAPSIVMSSRNDLSFREEVARSDVIQLFEKPLCLPELQATVRDLVLF